MKKILVLFFTISFVLAMVACHSNAPPDNSMEEDIENITNATDYAVSVFCDTKPEDYTIVRKSSNVNHNVDDAIYHITLTYTIGDDDTQYSYGYTIVRTGEQFSVLEEIDSK